jgi:hypothetical protein
LKNKAVHSGRMSGHNGTEKDVDRDWVNEDDAVVGEGGGGLGQKTKEAAVSEDEGALTQIPQKVFFFLMIALRARGRKQGQCPPQLRGRHRHGLMVRAQKPADGENEPN